MVVIAVVAEVVVPGVRSVATLLVVLPEKEGIVVVVVVVVVAITIKAVVSAEVGSVVLVSIVKEVSVPEVRGAVDEFDAVVTEVVL